MKVNYIMQYFNKQIFFILSIILFVTLPIKSLANSKYKTAISIFNEGVHIPIAGGFTSNPFHPGISIGLERKYNSNLKNILFQTLNCGLYLHKTFEHGLYLNTESGYRHIYKPGITNEISIGIGYLHTFSATKQYELNSNGEFTEKNTKGRPHAMISAAIGLGYDFSTIFGKELMIYLKYQPFIELPYSDDNSIPLMIHTSLHLGTTFKFPKNR